MSNSTQTNSSMGELALSLPVTAFTRSGISFNPRDDLWEWRDGPFQLRLYFARVCGEFIHLREPLKRCLLVFAKGSSSAHLHNLFQAFLHFLAARKSADSMASISVREISDYAVRLGKHEQSRLGTLNVLLQKWSSLNLPGVDAECTEYLRERRKPGNEKGAAVRTRDPVDGPFSEAEYTALYKAADAAYGTGGIPLWVAVLTRLLFACGGRISQYASLKLGDFVSQQSSFILRLPQAKTREAHTRITLRDFDLSPQTGRLIQGFVDYLVSQGYGMDSPMFHEHTVMKQGPRSETRSSSDLFFGHCTAKTLANALTAELAGIAPPTERLGFEAMPVAPKRFRYTFATRMAEEGASKAVIADRLGHVDLQNVDVYFEASPKIVENIDKAMGALLAPLARAFRGRLVEDESESTLKGVPGSRIIDFRVAKAPVGSCGGGGTGCAFNKPVACYTCFKFEPWLDAPHGKVLARLQAERDRLADDERMAAINDDAILAIQEVIAECDLILEQRGNGVQA